jgi:hypothetical protein
MALPTTGTTLEAAVPQVQFNGLNTLKASNLAGFLVDTSGNTTVPGTLAVTSTSTFTGAATFTAQPVFTAGLAAGVTNGSVTAIATQNGTPTTAQLIGGFINHASVTGAGTLTVPQGATISAAITGVAVGTQFRCLYYNSGTQTVTITGDTGSTITGGTAAVTTGKQNLMTFVCTATNTWLVLLTTLF